MSGEKNPKYHGFRWDSTNNRLYINVGGNDIGYFAAGGLTVLGTAQTPNGFADDILIKLGTSEDIALVLASAGLAANTTLAGVSVGTPVTPTLEANSLIIANITADGDIAIFTQTGGNTHAVAWYDTSAATWRFYAGAGVEILKLASAVATLTGTLTVSGLVTASASAAVTGQVLHGAASDGSTPGTSTSAYKTGTPPVGAATTTSKLYASSTVNRKIIADGTDSAVG